MSIFPKDVQDAANKMNGAWIKGADFEEGLTLKIKATEKIKSQYGARAEDSIVEKNILEEGETFRYTFVDSEGVERRFDSASMPFFIAMQSAEFNFGDWLMIKREGKGDKTRYSAVRVEAPVSQRNSEEDPGDITAF